MRLGRLAARLVIGGLFIGHGTQKLFGWFGGPGREGTERMMEKLEMRPPRANALLVGAAETAGGGMVASGFLTPAGASALIASMITAIRKVHGTKGVWNSQGGYEFNLVLIAALLALVDGGPGPISVDRLLGLDETGHRWALAALAAGAAGSAIAIEAGRRLAEEQEAASEPGSADVGSATAGTRGSRFAQEEAERVGDAAIAAA
jgi:putative oxidoreductase